MSIHNQTDKNRIFFKLMAGVTAISIGIATLSWSPSLRADDGERLSASISRVVADLAAKTSADAPVGTAAPPQRRGFSDEASNARISTGWNYKTASSCFGGISGGVTYYILNFTDGTAIYVADNAYGIAAGAAAFFSSACASRASVALRITAVNGNSFNWDVVGFASAL